LTLALAGGALRVLGGALTHSLCKLCLKKFSPPWGCRCTHCTPGYAYKPRGVKLFELLREFAKNTPNNTAGLSVRRIDFDLVNRRNNWLLERLSAVPLPEYDNSSTIGRSGSVSGRPHPKESWSRPDWCGDVVGERLSSGAASSGPITSFRSASTIQLQACL